jgi:hypothetical protein
MPVPDPAHSRAVLIGIGAYTHPDLKPLPSAAAGARRLAALLRDRTVWGLPPEHVTELGAESSTDQILQAVHGAARQATDTLLVYFAGHGLRDRAERLYLALAGADADQPEIGTVSYRALRNVLRQSGHRARYRLTVLDCCYSGLAGAMSASTTPTRADLARALDERQAQQIDDTDYGDCVLTSAPPTRPSFAPPEAAYPEFTGALIDILDRGVMGAGPTLSVDDVWQRVRHRLRERGSPEPQQFAQNGVARHVHLHNRAVTGLNPSSEEPVLRRVGEADDPPVQVRDGRSADRVPRDPERRRTILRDPKRRETILRDLERSNRTLDRAMRRSSRPRNLWTRVALLAVTGSALAGGIGYALWASWPDGDRQGAGSSKSSAPAQTTTAPPSNRSSAPARQPDGSPDLGKQAVNSKAIMRLPRCTETDSSVTLRLTSARNSYHAEHTPTFVLNITSPSACRVNVIPESVQLSIAPALDNLPIWSSTSCTAQPRDRWIAASPKTPAVVTYRWNRLPNKSCDITEKAEAGVYVATASLDSLFIPDARTSFVLSAD